MTGFAIQGWCPGALRPMQSGDGLVVRIRPRAGRLSADQARGIAQAAAQHGSGLIDLSARGNLQLRGVTEASHPALIDDLRKLDLIDPDPRTEAARNLLVTPFADAQTEEIAADFARALTRAPVLPGKFGFVLDTGPAPLMQDIAGDIRLERDDQGGLLLRSEGLPLGAPVTAENAAQQAMALAEWFLAQGGVQDGRGRMAALIARGARPEGSLAPRVAPAPAQPAPGPGLQPQGALVGFDFGQLTAKMLFTLSGLGPLRLTPWRMLLVEGLKALPDLPGLILTADNPLRRVQACTGAPGCLQARAATRPLARRLAAQVPPGQTLHVSGCAKGCAHPGPADLVLVATGTGFDLIVQGRAGDAPQRRGLGETELDLKGLI
ncbi:precorrin-3B synthase [Xinfangfangia pollutisoli]|uniref:precorrin-3B synthase n=1 Tax=Xinfangfangia pollutisoli TaxID=2865960 RepID=UPI001CD580F3|nr:precorrin-3B synthase [Xinfangfangia pollutisoli]